jgi:hypothetical protein
VKLPDAKPVPKQEFQRFTATTTPYFSLLEDYKEQIQLALAR